MIISSKKKKLQTTIINYPLDKVAIDGDIKYDRPSLEKIVGVGSSGIVSIGNVTKWVTISSFIKFRRIMIIILRRTIGFWNYDK